MRFFRGALGREVFCSPRGSDAEARERSLAPLLTAEVPRGNTDVPYSLRELADLRADDPDRTLELWLLGGASERTLAEFAARGIEVHFDLAGFAE